MTPAPPPPRFARVGGRLVTWRACGTGAAAVLLHGSPQSSRALAGLGEAVAAAGMCAIMPDTPGAGHSDPLGRPDLCIADLAEALAAFVDRIGLGRFALYGTHTGAAIALAFAARYPGRITTLILDGIAAWTEAERAAYRESYAPPFRPSWDGAHLTWLWSRMEAQSLFFPWHQHTQTTWRGVDLSPPWHLHRNAMDMLDSGDAYRAIYQASLNFDPAEFLPLPVAPNLRMLGADVLKAHAARAPLDGLNVTLFDDAPSLWRAVAAELAMHPGDPAPALPAPGMFWRGTLAGNGKPLVLLHPAGASSRVFAAQLPELAARGPVLAFDLPGHGFDESLLPGSAPEIGARVAAECRVLGLAAYDAAGHGVGGIIAGAMANAHIRGTTLSPRATAPDLAQKGAVSLEPEWDGSHLLRAWRVACRQAMFQPWYDTTAAAARRNLGALDAENIHAAALDLLRAGRAWITANAVEAAAG